MTSDDVRQLVETEIGDRWGTTNIHKVDLRAALTVPKRITVIQRFVDNGRVRDEECDVWLVLEEKAQGGYKIVFDEDLHSFGLASGGFPSDQHVVLVGWYGDFMTTFLGM